MAGIKALTPQPKLANELQTKFVAMYQTEIEYILDTTESGGTPGVI